MAVHAIFTGPIKATELKLSDGTVIDVRPDIIYVDSQEKADEVAHHIALHYLVNGHPDHDVDHPFVYNAPEGR